MTTLLALASLALRQSGLVQLHPKPIPPIDFQNLPYQETVRKMAEGWRVKYGLPGVWCAFVKDGRVVACVANGYKDLETKAPALVTDHLNVGSVSKVITGTLIAELVAMGVISYETTVGQTFPELARKYPNNPFLDASLAQLLTHTAGLTSKVTSNTADKPDGKTWRLGYVEDALASDAVSLPGTVYEYSNAGPVIATAMAERMVATRQLESQVGAEFEDWYQGPLGRAIGLTNPKMRDYARVPEVTEVQPHYLAEAGAVANKKVLRDSFRYVVSGSCSVTLTDLCRFALATMGNLAGFPDTVYQRSTHFSKDVSELRECTEASWEGNDQRFLHHAGSTGRGEFCDLWVYCRAKCALIFFTNCNKQGGNFYQTTPGLDDDLSRLRWVP